jgi:hypothetical protein
MYYNSAGYMGMHRFDVSCSLTSASRFDQNVKGSKNTNVNLFGAAKNALADVRDYVANIFAPVAPAFA